MKFIKELKFISEYLKFRRISRLHTHRFSLRYKDRYPCIHDRTKSTSFDSHYVYHTSWAARILAQRNPTYHIDISSDLRFVTLVSAFIPIKFYDYRPPSITLSNLTCEHADALSLPFEDDSVKSLSCMHVVEHIGLGRYGDPLDYEGDLKAILELIRVLSRNSDLYFVVPIGKPTIRFNAHRIYSHFQIVEYFKKLTLLEFTLIQDSGEVTRNASAELADRQNYGCGCFWFKKK